MVVIMIIVLIILFMIMMIMFMLMFMIMADFDQFLFLDKISGIVNFVLVKTL